LQRTELRQDGAACKQADARPRGRDALEECLLVTGFQRARRGRACRVERGEQRAEHCDDDAGEAVDHGRRHGDPQLGRNAAEHAGAEIGA
jgi:hypothetical protein